MPYKVEQKTKFVSLTETSAWYQVGSNPSSGENTSTVVAGEVISDRWDRGWNNTPGYRSMNQVQRSSLPAQGFTYSRYRASGKIWASRPYHYTGGPGSDRVFTKTELLGDSRLVWGPLISFGQDLVSNDDVYLRARGKLQEERTWRAPLFLAEMGKSAKMVNEVARDIVMTLRAVRRRDLKWLKRRFDGRVRNAADTSEGLWLQYKYGWLPLLRDAHDASIALANLAQRWDLGQVRTVKVSLSRFKESTTDSVASPGSFVFQTVETYKRKQSKRLGLKYRVSNTNQYTASSLGLFNPASLAWEVIPFSFVADWFVPIGAFLDSLDAGIGLTFLPGGYLSTRSEFSREILCKSGPGFTVGTNHADVLLNVSREQRDTLPSVSLSGVTVHPNLGASQLISAIALIRQLTR